MRALLQSTSEYRLSLTHSVFVVVCWCCCSSGHTLIGCAFTGTMSKQRFRCRLLVCRSSMAAREGNCFVSVPSAMQSLLCQFIFSCNYLAYCPPYTRFEKLMVKLARIVVGQVFVGQARRRLSSVRSGHLNREIRGKLRVLERHGRQGVHTVRVTISYCPVREDCNGHLSAIGQVFPLGINGCRMVNLNRTSLGNIFIVVLCKSIEQGP